MNSDWNVVSLELVSTNVGKGNRQVCHREALLMKLPPIKKHISFTRMYNMMK